MNQIRTPRYALPLTAALLCLGGALRPVTAQTPTPAPSLYQRLGGYDALAAVTDDFIGRLVTDSSLTRFFGGHGKDSKGRIRQLVLDQLCAVTGGPCVYIGRDMKTTHAGLGITQANWDRAVQLLVATLDKFKVPQKEQQEVLAAVSTLKGDIVERP
ncbi:MAG TPA: group 1 truncated hemoglobin [Gemmatimonadales bacterium]